MDYIKFYLNLVFIKALNKILKLFKYNATSLSGKIVLNFNKNFLKTAKHFVKKGIINITGTNGKTTTSYFKNKQSKNRVKFFRSKYAKRDSDSNW